MSKKVIAIGCAFALALAVVIIIGVSARAQEETHEEAQALDPGCALIYLGGLTFAEATRRGLAISFVTFLRV